MTIGFKAKKMKIANKEIQHVYFFDQKVFAFLSKAKRISYTTKPKLIGTRQGEKCRHSCRDILQYDYYGRVFSTKHSTN